MNLLHNAVVHNRAEHGTVNVTTALRAGFATLTVENTGDPLTPQPVSTLTEPFRRGTGRIRDDHAGVGLGLAIVKSIVNAHDGTLTIVPGAHGGLRVKERRKVVSDESSEWSESVVIAATLLHSTRHRDAWRTRGPHPARR